jgi:hypothetical protein
MVGTARRSPPYDLLDGIGVRRHLGNAIFERHTLKKVRKKKRQATFKTSMAQHAKSTLIGSKRATACVA